MSASSVTCWDRLRPGDWATVEPVKEELGWDPRCRDCHNEPRYLEDRITHRRYPHRSIEQMRDRCFAWTVVLPTVGSLIILADLVRKVVIVVTFSHFWWPSYLEIPWENRAINMGEDILKIAAAPFALIGLELAAIYGILSPYDGMKLFETIKRWHGLSYSPLLMLDRGEAEDHAMRHLAQDVVIGDFWFWNEWRRDPESGLFGGAQCEFQRCPQEPRLIIDETTNRRYFNDDLMTIRIKGLLLTIGTSFIHPIAMIHNIAYRILRTVTLSRLWVEKEGETSYKLSARLQDMGGDLLKIVAAPIALMGLELAALYAIANPLDGKKLYATIERAEYGGYILAACFQPGYTVYHRH